jgi:uncharacterized tellurite resistance protein B-like protein
MIECAGLLNALKALIADPSAPRRFGPQDLRVAAAVLLVHVVDSDGAVTPGERLRLRELVMEHFELDLVSANELLEIAVRRDRETLDPSEFATTLTRQLDKQTRRELVAMMWDVARADGRVSGVEETAIWRVARLLDVLDPRGFAEEAMRSLDGAPNAEPSLSAQAGAKPAEAASHGRRTGKRARKSR